MPRSIADNNIHGTFTPASSFLQAASALALPIVVADASKFGHNSFAHIAPLGRIQVLVTDEQPPSDLAQALAEADVELIVAPGE